MSILDLSGHLHCAKPAQVGTTLNFLNCKEFTQDHWAWVQVSDTGEPLLRGVLAFCLAASTLPFL